MANGRMITNSICADKRVNQLQSDTSRLAFTWLVTFADREGRTYGDPAMVRSMLFPRRQDVSIEQMETIIAEWADLGLIIWYECDGDLWIWFPGFEKNQSGLRKDKEAPSKVPEPTFEGADLVRSRYGLTTDLLPLKRIEENRREGNDGATTELELSLYKQVTKLTPDFGHLEEVKRNIKTLLDTNGGSQSVVLGIMQDKYAIWCATKTDAGKPYNPTNPKWLEWCLTNFTPQNGNGKRGNRLLTGV